MKRPLNIYLIVIIILIVFLTIDQKNLEILTGRASSVLYNISVNVTGAPANVTNVTPPAEAEISRGVTREGFIVSTKTITEKLLQGQEKTLILNVTNTGEKILNINIELKNLEKFASVSENNFFLDINETKSLQIRLFALPYLQPIVYTGRIIAKSYSLQSIVNVVLEIKEKIPTFSVLVEIPPKYKNTTSGSEITSAVKLTTLPEESINLKTKLFIIDFSGNILNESPEEVLAVKESLLVTRELTIPPTAPEGEYTLIVRAAYGDIIAESYDTFNVTEKVVGFVPGMPHYILLMIIVLIAVLLFMRMRHIRDLQAQGI